MKTPPGRGGAVSRKGSSEAQPLTMEAKEPPTGGPSAVLRPSGECGQLA